MKVKGLSGRPRNHKHTRLLGSWPHSECIVSNAILDPPAVISIARFGFYLMHSNSQELLGSAHQSFLDCFT
jgi:hypothetical protein